MKRFINLNELKLEKNQMNAIKGGAGDILVGPKIQIDPKSPVMRYAVPLYGIKPVAFPRYAVAG